MFRIRKKSAWSYDTSAGGSVGAGVVTAGTGSLWFSDPKDLPEKYNYASFGGGLSVGVKVNVASSTPESFSAGSIYILESFRGAELSHKDFEGFSLSLDASVGAGLGASGSIMVLGLSATEVPAALADLTLSPALALEARDAAQELLQKSGWLVAGNGHPKMGGKLVDAFKGAGKALLVMGGFNAGPQITAGVSASLGYVWRGETPQWKGTQDVWRQMEQALRSPEETTIRSSTTSQDVSFIRIPAHLLFDFDKYDIKPAAAAELESIADMIRSRQPRSLSVEGHTDSVGGHSYNFQLSTRRAQSVARWLVSRNVIESGNVKIIGRGDFKPIAPNDTVRNRQKNRRVEIFLNTS